MDGQQQYLVTRCGQPCPGGWQQAGPEFCSQAERDEHRPGAAMVCRHEEALQPCPPMQQRQVCTTTNTTAPPKQGYALHVVVSEHKHPTA